MAIEVLCDDQPRDTREARHDLESFYWLLIFVVLRHRPCCIFRGDPETCYRILFKQGEHDNSGKHQWISMKAMPIKVMANEPLTKLLEDLRQLCKTNYRSNDRALNARWMTHEDFLRAFDEALQHREQWPPADCAQMRVGRHDVEPAYARDVSTPTAVLTTISRPGSGEDLPPAGPAPVKADDEAPPRPGSAAPASVESQKDPKPDDGDADAAPPSVEKNASVQEDAQPVHAMETRARAAARARAAQTAGASEAPQRRGSEPRQGRKRGRAQEDDVVVDGPSAPEPLKRPRRVAAPTGGRTREAKQPQRRKGKP